MMDTSLFSGQCYRLKSKVLYMLFCKRKVYTVFSEGLILLVLFYPINLIVFTPWMKTSFSCLHLSNQLRSSCLFFWLFLSLSPWQFSSLLKKYVILLNYDPPILDNFWKNSTLPMLIITPTIYLYKLCISEVKMIKTKTEGRPNF